MQLAHQNLFIIHRVIAIWISCLIADLLRLVQIAAPSWPWGVNYWPSYKQLKNDVQSCEAPNFRNFVPERRNQIDSIIKIISLTSKIIAPVLSDFFSGMLRSIYIIVKANAGYGWIKL